MCRVGGRPNSSGTDRKYHKMINSVVTDPVPGTRGL